MKWRQLTKDNIPDILVNIHFRFTGSKSPVPYRSVEKFESFGNIFLRFWNTSADIKTEITTSIEFLDESPESSVWPGEDLQSIINKHWTGKEINGVLIEAIAKEYAELIAAPIRKQYDESWSKALEYYHEIERLQSRTAVKAEELHISGNWIKADNILPSRNYNYHVKKIGFDGSVYNSTSYFKNGKWYEENGYTECRDKVLEYLDNQFKQSQPTAGGSETHCDQTEIDLWQRIFDRCKEIYPLKKATDKYIEIVGILKPQPTAGGVTKGIRDAVQLFANKEGKVDLVALQKRFDEFFEKETVESFEKWQKTAGGVKEEGGETKI